MIGLLAASFLHLACTDRRPVHSIDPSIASLTELSIDSLRARPYQSTIRIVEPRPNETSDSYMATYDSDGLRVYARIDLPLGPPPETGYPIVVFVHGWIGIDAAPELDFYYDEDNNYGEMIEAYVTAGFAVFTPGWRGHGTLDGVPAEGIEFMQAWDNGSYLSPVFYAIDVLNLIDGLQTIEFTQLDLQNINLVGHSQGGDVALIALAVAGEGSAVDNDVHAASIWSGTFPSRLMQLETYWPMQKSPQAFMSGDGTWNGTAVALDGRINEHFVFGYPAHWIGTTNRDEWTWQKETWSQEKVADTLRLKLDEMYTAVNTFVDDMEGAEYQLTIDDSGAFTITHDARVRDALALVGGFHAERFLTEKLALQYSDRDFYSFPEWNTDLCSRINHADGRCYEFEYAENTHSLRTSEHDWFSGADAVPGFSYALQRDIALFRGLNPREIHFP